MNMLQDSHLKSGDLEDMASASNQANQKTHEEVEEIVLTRDGKDNEEIAFLCAVLILDERDHQDSMKVILTRDGKNNE